jgi:hypothetical protein
VVPSFFRTTFPDSSPDAPSRTGIAGLFLVVILGLVIRVLACQQTAIINPDGVYYIHQAKALYYGEWDVLTSRALDFVSIYPFLVAGAYALVHDWVTAAQSVSCLFGTLVLIPIYFLCRRFFNRDISLLTLLVFALLPVFVSGSAEVVRGPVCWFFLATGLTLFMASDEGHERLFLPLSCLAFVMASWARIESTLFIAISLIYLMAVPPKGRMRKAGFFALPLVVILFGIACAAIFLDRPLMGTLRLDEVPQKLWASSIAYQDIRTGLAELMRQPLDGMMPHFLHKTRNMVWLVALGTLVRYMVRAYFYLLFLFFILGLGGVWRRLRKDRRVFYLSFLSLSAFILLYVHIIQTWMMFDRFWAIFMLPAVVVIGFGVRKVVFFLNIRCRVQMSTALLLVSFLTLACALPKDMKPREADKTVYREIGAFIAEMEGNDREIRILKSLRTPNWVPFYANLRYEGAAGPRCDFGMDEAMFEERVFRDRDAFVRYLREGGIDYVLWEEGAWPEGAVDLSGIEPFCDLETIRAWHHSDVGKMILYKVVRHASEGTGAGIWSGPGQGPAGRAQEVLVSDRPS